jgi:hypothetical protein
MKKYLWAVALMAMGTMSAMGSAGASSAYVEQALVGGVTITSSGALGIDLGVEYPLPASLLPVDTSLELTLSTFGLLKGSVGFGVDLGIKALLFPSLFNEPSTALALRADLGLASSGVDLKFGPLATLDFNPLTVNLGLYPTLGFGGGFHFGLGYEAGIRYYLEDTSNNAIEVGVRGDALNGSSAALSLGGRFSF